MEGETNLWRLCRSPRIGHCTIVIYATGENGNGKRTVLRRCQYHQRTLKTLKRREKRNVVQSCVYCCDDPVVVVDFFEHLGVVGYCSTWKMGFGLGTDLLRIGPYWQTTGDQRQQKGRIFYLGSRASSLAFDWWDVTRHSWCGAWKCGSCIFSSLRGEVSVGPPSQTIRSSCVAISEQQTCP